ncbi:MULTISPECIES: hypothetical protein [Burkholderia]|nr:MULTISPECIES: hypothetical protein [Burkholderia]
MMDVLAVAEPPYSTDDTAPTMTNALRFFRCFMLPRRSLFEQQLSENIC